MKARPLALLALALAWWGTAPLRAADDTFYTHDFPEPDRAEIAAVTEPGEAGGPWVKLGPPRARNLARLLRGLTWNSASGGCDRVQYEMRFYARGKLVADDVICFHCGCFAPLRSDLHGPGEAWTFILDNKASDRLWAFLHDLLSDSND